VSGGSIPNQYIPAVHKGVLEKIHEGCFAGYRVQNVVIELFFGKDHPVDSSENAFKIAGRKCVQQIFQQADPILLEPMVKLDIYVPTEYIGAISGDLTSRRGHMLGMLSQPGGYQIITAVAPQGEILTYSRVLTSITGGKGSYLVEFSHHSVLPYHEQIRVLKESGYLELS
jgi:elongation factor G